MTKPQEVYTVTQLNASAREILEQRFSCIRVEGEISNFINHSSGHMYFSLKDEHAQVRCAFFRGRNRALNFLPENGMQVEIQAQVSLYEVRGEYQLIVETLQGAGDGALRRAFELLKNKLEKQGLFSLEHKKPLPTLPACVGVITSPSGAAIKDILTVLKRRFAAIPVIIYPAQVQGEAAAPQLVQAIETANRRRECDVIILARGGGSLEDLWAFNDETLAQAIFRSQIPIVSGVGHEVDFTIADFVADQRAPTPSAAAELVSPDLQQWQENFRRREQRLAQLIRQLFKECSQSLTALFKQLRHPGHSIRERMQTMDYLEQNLIRALLHDLNRRKTRVHEYTLHLRRHNPLLTIAQQQAQQHQWDQRLRQSMKNLLSGARQKLANLSRALDTVSPLATLDRGYAIMKIAATGTIIQDARQVKPGDKIQAQIARGELSCTVDKVFQASKKRIRE